MSSSDVKTGSSAIIRLLLAFTAVFFILLYFYTGYSFLGYTLTKNSMLEGQYTLCIEGDMHPINQSMTLINDDTIPTIKPYVLINDARHDFDLDIRDKAVNKRIGDLKSGCNTITFGSRTPTQYKLKLDYVTMYRPRIEYIEINNLKAGHTARFFIATKDPHTRRIVKTRFNLTDISSDRGIRLADLEFNGTAVRYKIDDPGNFLLNLQVFDGDVESDIYEVGFQAHVITTDERKDPYRTYALILEGLERQKGVYPPMIEAEDKEYVKVGKRLVIGSYMRLKPYWDWMRNLLVPIFKEE